MARFLIFATFFAAGAFANRVGHTNSQHERHADSQTSGFDPRLLSSMPRHVQMHGAASSIHSIHSGNTSQLNLYGGAPGRISSHTRSPVTSMKDPGYHPGLPDDWRSRTGNFVFFDRYAQADLPPKLSVNVGSLVRGWKDFASRTLQQRTYIRRQNGLAITLANVTLTNEWKALEQLSEDIDGTSQKGYRPWQPTQMFGLTLQEPSTEKSSPESIILAMASVQFLSVWDGSGTIGDPEHRLEAVHINHLASTPEWSRLAFTSGIAGSPLHEMLHKISDWAELTGKLVTVSPSDPLMQAYYAGFGFEFLPTADGGRMVYHRDRSSRPGDAPRLFKPDLRVALVTLQNDDKLVQPARQIAKIHSEMKGLK